MIVRICGPFTADAGGSTRSRTTSAGKRGAGNLGTITIVTQDILAFDTSTLARSAFLVLLALADGPGHGLGIIDRVESATGGTVKLGPGTLYGTLQHLCRSGLIRETAAPPGPNDDDPRRRYYRLAAKGEKALKAEAERLRALVRAAAARQILGDA
jgi:DNA-binding PadR family transcriptional regulator